MCFHNTLCLSLYVCVVLVVINVVDSAQSDQAAALRYSRICGFIFGVAGVGAVMCCGGAPPSEMRAVCREGGLW